MKIGKLANRAGVQVETVRFYERSGLMPPPSRRASGYREYDNHDVQRLRFVLRTKALGFSLLEIRDLLALSAQADGGDAAVRASAETKLAEIDTRLAHLTEIRDALRTMVGGPQHTADTGSEGLRSRTGTFVGVTRQAAT